MRILIVNKYARVTGGADTHCLALAASLRGRGHDVAFLSTEDDGNVETEGAFVPRTVSSADKHTLAPRRQARAAASALWSARAHASMQRLLATFQPDVVNAHKLYPQLSVSPLVAARRAGVPVVQTVQDYEFVSASPYDESGRWTDRDESRRSFRALNACLFAVRATIHRRTVSRWLTVSRYMAERLASRGIASEILPNIAPPVGDRRAPFAARAGIAFAGRLCREKGVADVLRLAELLPATRVAVAGDGPERSAVESAARRLPNLDYLGPLPTLEVRALFARSRVAVVPSVWQEPGALVTLEAMSAGTPLVVYRVGGIAEYVADSSAGITVEPRPADLAAACRTLLAGGASWEERSRAGVAAADGSFSAETHCARLEAIFDEVARGRRPPTPLLPGSARTGW